ncbi:vacuolar protein sorting-associated protein 37A-like [Phyllobates terribilis]|uniref:vacuolar protein sorting-associated protein 37A-like n=1 Tax=Phyllobates terribilis TaxID=111132 RepID=UPI003CCB1775
MLATQHLPTDIGNPFLSFRLYSNPAGRPPYPLSGFSLFPPFPTQDNNRSVPVSEPVPSTYNSAKTAAPAYGLITDLPVPVPPSEVGVNGFTYKMPDLPETFPELSDLSVSQLTDMMEQEDVLLEQIVNLPQLKQIISDKEELVKNIEELSCGLSALQARLKVAAHQAEEDSDNFAENFLEGKTEIDDFLTLFMEKRRGIAAINDSVSGLVSLGSIERMLSAVWIWWSSGHGLYR